MINDMLNNVKIFMLSNYNFFLKQVALAMGTISCILTIFIGIWPRLIAVVCGGVAYLLLLLGASVQ